GLGGLVGGLGVREPDEDRPLPGRLGLQRREVWNRRLLLLVLGRRRLELLLPLRGLVIALGLDVLRPQPLVLLPGAVALLLQISDFLVLFRRHPAGFAGLREEVGDPIDLGLATLEEPHQTVALRTRKLGKLMA